MGDIIAFNNIKVGEYNGKSLNVSEESKFTTKYEGREQIVLKKWYEEEKPNIRSITSLTEDKGSFNPRENAVLIAEIN